MLKDDLLRDGLITKAEYNNWKDIEINKEALGRLCKYLDENLD